jgi:hypothetical protein
VRLQPGSTTQTAGAGGDLRANLAVTSFRTQLAELRQAALARAAGPMVALGDPVRHAMRPA